MSLSTLLALTMPQFPDLLNGDDNALCVSDPSELVRGTQGLVNRVIVGAVDRPSLAVLRLVLLCGQLPSIC